MKWPQWFIACVILALAISGCGDKGAEGESATEQGANKSSSALPAYPESLSAESTPTEVATVLITALDAGNNQTLLGLVAIDKGMAEMGAIYRKHGRKSPLTPAKVAVFTVTGWRASHKFVKKNETQVDRESISGETATVFAKATSPVGKPCTLQITLVREAGLWKVAPGIKSVVR
jgi:hypothetical protein